jgi:ankyrin repeat protein
VQIPPLENTVILAPSWVVRKMWLVSCTDKQGWTPLHYACEFGRTEVVSLLVAARASVNCADEIGRTPLMCVDRTSRSRAGMVALPEAAAQRERVRYKDVPAHQKRARTNKSYKE